MFNFFSKDANNNFPSDTWVFFAYSVNITAGQQRISHFYVQNPATPSFYQAFQSQPKAGLYTITPNSTLYVGTATDMTMTGGANYVRCYCKVVAWLYSGSFIDAQSELEALAWPEPRKTSAHYFGG